MPSVHPLAGHVVVEIGHSVAAPYAGLILAELGMEVIKVENPGGGDAARGWGPPFADGKGAHFIAFNRNKKTISVDFKDVDACKALRDLIIERADVVISNVRAGSLSKFGLDQETLLGAKESLVYCDIGAFGAVGPLAGKPGYDPLMQAFCGIMSVTGESVDRPPVRVGVSMIDMGAGLWAAIGVISALFERLRTGRGGHVETSLFETACAWATVPITRHLMGGGAQLPQGSGAAGIVPYQAFRTQDGWLVIGAGNDRLFGFLAQAMMRPELASDPRFIRNRDRVVHQRELLPIIEAFAKQYSSSALSQLLDGFDIPNAPVQTIEQVATTPQTAALGLVQSLDDPSAPKTVGVPLRFDGERPRYHSCAPRLGEDTETVLKSLAAL